MHGQLSSQRRQVIASTTAKYKELEGAYHQVCEDRRAEVKALETVVSDLRFEKGQLAHKLVLHGKTIDELRRSVIASSIDGDASSDGGHSGGNVYEEQVRTISELRRERDNALESAASVKSSSEREANAWQRERTQLMARCDEAESSNSKAVEARRQLVENLNRLQIECNENARREKLMVSEHRNAVNALRASSQASQTELQQRIQQLQIGLERKVATKVDDIARAQEMLQQSETVAGRYKEETERLKSRIDVMKDEAEIKKGSLQEELKQKSQHVSELTASNRALEKDLSAARMTLKSIVPTVDNLKQRDVQLREHIRELARERDSLLAEKSRHLSEIDELDMLRNRMSRQRDNALDKVKALQHAFCT